MKDAVVVKVVFKAFCDAVNELTEELNSLKDAVVVKVVFKAFCDAV